MTGNLKIYGLNGDGRQTLICSTNSPATARAYRNASNSCWIKIIVEADGRHIDDDELDELAASSAALSEIHPRPISSGRIKHLHRT